MRHTDSRRSERCNREEILLVVLILCQTGSGCTKACVSFSTDHSNTTIVLNNTSCTLTKANGTVVLELNSTSAPAAGADQNNIRHIFITLYGVEAHPNATAGEDSQEWQELAPELGTQPAQLDLMALKSAAAPFEGMGEAAMPVSVPADVYRQIRLRLAPNHTQEIEPIPQENACGNVGIHCVVLADGTVRPLVFEGAKPEVRIGPESLSEGFLRVLPDAATRVSIQFEANSSVAFPTDDGVRLALVFKVDSQILFLSSPNEP